jgi:hypothetical protein
MAGLCVNFYEASILFSRVVAPAFIPTSGVPGFLLPTSSPTHVVGNVFGDGYSNKGEVES